MWTRRVHLCVATYCALSRLVFCLLYYGTTALEYFVAAADAVLGVAILLVLAIMMPSLELIDTLAAWERPIVLVIWWLPCFRARSAASCTVVAARNLLLKLLVRDPDFWWADN